MMKGPDGYISFCRYAADALYTLIGIYTLYYTSTSCLGLLARETCSTMETGKTKQA